MHMHLNAYARAGEARSYSRWGGSLQESNHSIKLYIIAFNEYTGNIMRIKYTNYRVDSQFIATRTDVSRFESRFMGGTNDDHSNSNSNSYSNSYNNRFCTHNIYMKYKNLMNKS